MASQLIDEAKLAIGLVTAFYNREYEGFDLLLTDCFKSAESIICTIETLSSLSAALLETISEMTGAEMNQLLQDTGKFLVEMEMSGEWDD